MRVLRIKGAKPVLSVACSAGWPAAQRCKYARTSATVTRGRTGFGGNHRSRPRHGHTGAQGDRDRPREACSVEIHPAHARVGAGAAARADRRLGRTRCCTGVGGEGGKLLLEMFLPARRAFQFGPSGTPHQLLKLGPAFPAFVFVNRHGSTSILEYKSCPSRRVRRRRFGSSCSPGSRTPPNCHRAAGHSRKAH